MIDVASQIGAVRREVRDGERDGAATKVRVAAQTYDTSVDDVWDAITSAERINRWLMAVTGDLRLGGRYQLEGNAGGEVRECDPPRRLAITWEWGGDVSWVEVTLVAEAADRTTLELEHTAKVSPEWGDFGPGAVGIGWDLMLVGLARHLQDGPTSAPRLEGDGLGRVRRRPRVHDREQHGVGRSRDRRRRRPRCCPGLGRPDRGHVRRAA